MHLYQILILAIIQGAAEMLPISSSAHVTIAARLMGFDLGNDNQWAFLLIMLHTGTMLAVLVYFRSRWKSLWKQAPALVLATAATLVVGCGLKVLITHFFLHGSDGKEPDKIEHLFRYLPLIAAGLAAAGITIIAAGWKDHRVPGRQAEIGGWQAAVMGVVQAFALPFRGFSRSGSTISTGLFFGIQRIRAEEFSFTLAVLLTPVVIVYEAREIVVHGAAPSEGLAPLILPGLVGMCFSFAAGLVALRLLSRWLERGRWQWFGGYCLIAAAVVLAIHFGMPEKAPQAAQAQLTRIGAAANAQ
jgi:undecaprenyl-diphosphatase